MSSSSAAEFVGEEAEDSGSSRCSFSELLILRFEPLSFLEVTQELRIQSC